MTHDTTSQRSVRAFVSQYYGEVLEKTADLKTNACCAAGAPPAFVAAALANVHPDILDRFYGCGFPIPRALEGATVLDLGCGTGRDVYILSQLVGPGGFVHGVDMTESQLALAREHVDHHTEAFGYDAPNVAFHQGYIEDLSSIAALADGSVDVVVSNCVVNLSPRKDLVLAEIARVLKPGGEFYFSDVFCDRRLPEDVAHDPVLHAECLGGAMYRSDFEFMAKDHGFLDPRVLDRAPITIQNDDIEAMVGAARFESVTLRLFKLPNLDRRCEDHGQIAVYKGTLPGAPDLFRLDSHHLFEAGRPERVCGNSASMLADTRLGAHFDVVGDTSVHYGAFDCSSTMAHDQYADAGDPSAASCC